MSKSSNNSSILSKKVEEEPKQNNTDEILKIKELNTDLINPNVNNYMDEKQGGHKIVIIGKPGTGKCLAYGTPIIMYDGSIKQVQNIKVGDVLMGDDSSPRHILTTCMGKDVMYRIKQSYGMDYVVNSPHILCLKDNENNVVEITVKDIINNENFQKDKLKGYKVNVDFEYQNININPYILGTCHNLRNLNTSIEEIKNIIYKHLNNLKCNFRLSINNLESYTNNVYQQLYENNNINPYKFNSKIVRNDYLSGLLDFNNILPYKYLMMINLL
jgi:replicative DNA helicase